MSLAMSMSRRGAAMLIGSEAVVPFRYRDSVGVDTEGIGHTAAAGAPDPAARPFGQEIPLVQVFRTFRRDLMKFEGRVNAALDVPVSQTQFDALGSFDFNTGGIHRARITREVNAGQLAAAAEAFDSWHRPPEIIPRRDAEKRLFRDGVYAHDGKATIYPADDRGRIQWSKGRRIDVMPIIDQIFAANEDEKAAAADVRKSTVTAGGGVGAGGAGSLAPQQGQAPVDGMAGGLGDAGLPTSQPEGWMGPEQTVADPAFIKWLLIALAIVLAVAALGYGIRAVRRRLSARRRDRAVAGEVGARLAVAPDVGDDTPVPFLGKARE